MIVDRYTYFSDKTEAQMQARVQLRLVKNHLPSIKDWQPKGLSVSASVNHGRWIGDCPVAGCNNAEFAGAGFPFVCTECGYGPATVVFPANRQAIEALLLERPLSTRNWTPGETLADLALENRERGIEDI